MFLDNSVEMNFSLGIYKFVIFLNCQKLFKTFFLFFISSLKKSYQIINKPISLYSV